MLERIEVHNFKSYKGHHVIGPLRTFTSLIGGNGTGKSNIMDAISFVLGIRSSQLRSSQLKDLIYRAGVRDGTQDEEGDDVEVSGRGATPTEEAARKASVTAVYTDKKGREWRYQRTITLAGVSEYRVNDKVVKAEHYNKTLEDHNILVKAKNFLVFQGDVEAVASQSPKDLTRLIEQISGSLDLKEEYDEAFKAQQDATEISTHNFNKRRGINSEIKQFKEQKSEAERYKSLQEDRDQAIIHHLVWKLYHIQNAIQSATTSIEEKNKSLEELKKEQAGHEESLKAARKQVASAQKAFQKHEKEVKKREKDLEDKRPELLGIDEKIKHAQKKVKRAQETAAIVDREKRDKEGAIKSLKDELAKVERAAANQREEHQRKSQSQGVTLNENDLREYNELKGSATKKAVKERHELDEAERSLRVKRTELATLKDAHEQATFDASKLAEEDKALDKRKIKQDARIKAVTHDLQEAKRQSNELSAERTRINQQSTELNEKLEECVRKLQQAGAEQKETDREAKFKRIIQDMQAQFPSRVKGRIVDLCKPSARKYDAAVSTVLGRNLDSIVVDSQATAQECIEFMRIRKAGVATFLPLDTITPKPINDKFRNYAHGARLAMDVINFAPEVERAMLFSCGNALVCDHMDIARHIVYEKGQEVKAVTLEGSIIHKSGLMTGGHDSKGPGGRQWGEQEVNNLRKQEQHYKTQLLDLMKHKPKVNVDERLLADITRLETELAGLKDDQSATKTRLKDVREKLSHARKQVSDFEARIEGLGRDARTEATKMEQLQKVVSQAEDTVFADFCRRLKIQNIRDYESKQLKEAQAHEESRILLHSQITRLKNSQNFEASQLENIAERHSTLQRIVTSETTKLETLQESRTDKVEELASLTEGIEAVESDISSLQEALDEKQAELEQVKKKANKSTKHFDRALKEIAALNDMIVKSTSERFGIYRRCNLEEIDLPLKKGSLDKLPLEEIVADENAMDIDEENAEETQEAKQAKDYGIEIDFDELEEMELDNDTPEMEQDLLNRVNTLQTEIDKVSPNMKAIDKLDEVEQKLAATTSDFEKARRQAKDAKDHFTEIKNRRSNLFNAAYNHIAEKIDVVYKDLTKGKAAPTGGVAYLSLEDAEEPYLHGIKYHAMPPMKRFRDMEQLSGGEKTMAALALLFAIHSYHPSPFFVLDEVDAALDNTNVGRVAEYVRGRASEDFQFIVISLKNTFWERARALVGIWRDVDASSSRVLTLDLDKYADI